MKRILTVSALCLTASVLFVPSAFAQTSSTTTQKSTEVAADGSTRTMTKTTTVDGTVLRYEAGKTIVVKGADDREISLVLSPNATVPGDIEVGRFVSLSTENSDAGPMTVTRITTRSVTPEGKIKTETQTHGTKPNGDQVSAKTTTVTGTVQSVQTGRSVTLVLPNKSTVEYTLDSASDVPADLAVGKTVTVQTSRTTSGGPLVVRRITSKQTTTTTKKVSTN